MLDITLITVGRLKEASYRAASEEYLKRLRPYARIKLVELPVVPFSSSNQEKSKELEGQKILNFLEKNKQKNNESFVYLLAERGKSFTSSELATWINKNQPLILIIGGALGFSPQLYKSYPQISLSSLTFPHELARVVLLEQLYRAVTILQKKDYHY